jgi:signal transduction histidine kinase
MRISYLIFLSFLSILLLFAFTTFINFRLSERVKENTDFVNQSGNIVRGSNRFQRNIINMGSGLRGFLLTGEDSFLQAYDSAATENKLILTDLFKQLDTTSRQYKLLVDIASLNNRWLSEFGQPLRQAKIGAEASDVNLPYFNKLYREKMQSSDERKLNTRLQEEIREFVNIEYEKRSEREKLLNDSLQMTKTISFFMITFSVLMALFIVSFLTIRISKRILQMVRMADSIAAGNYNVSTEETGKDELSGLARSLNYMAKTLSSNINELTKKNRELDQFAHIVSHDMKAPLRGIDNVVSWIEEDHKDELTPKVAEYIHLIKGRVIRGESLIQGLLSYARVGKEEEGEEKIDTRELLGEVLENFSLKEGITITVSEKMPVIYSVKLPLFQVFSNLIDNALKYNDKINGLVKVYHKEHPGHWEFFVSDNGPGISKNYHEKIFMIFQTLKERDSFESTGVGLAIVKKILDSRGEEIKLESEPGTGSIFSFTWKK